MTGVAVITGAARGLGAAVAHELAAAGWRLLLLDRCRDEPGLPYPLATPDDLAATVRSCAALVGEDSVRHAIVDVRDLVGMTAAIRSTADTFGGIDAAIAVAGVIAGGVRTWETGDRAYASLLDTNLLGVLNLARATVPLLLRSDAGRFVAVSSAAGVRGLPGLGVYAAAKHAVVGLIRSLAIELGPDGVTANVVAPGSMPTDLLQASADLYDLADPEEFVQHHLLPGLVDPRHVAAAIAWLLSPAGGPVTGAAIPVDAGMTV